MNIENIYRWFQSCKEKAQRNICDRFQGGTAYFSINRPIRATALALSLATLAACGDAKVQWLEDVQLLDGRLIQVKQSRRCQGDPDSIPRGGVCITRDVKLTFRLSDFSAEEIIWHERLMPLVLNVFKSRLYLISRPRTQLEFNDYGNPNPIYVAYEYLAGTWRRIPFTEVPVELYDTNMIIQDVPKIKAKIITVAYKLSQTENGNGLLSNDFRRLNPQRSWE